MCICQDSVCTCAQSVAGSEIGRWKLKFSDKLQIYTCFETIGKESTNLTLFTQPMLAIRAFDFLVHLVHDRTCINVVCIVRICMVTHVG